MANSYFQFKQFTVWHDKCAMKVGTDGVLLGAWAPAKDALRILDIGTGTGLVALMLAQRSQATITALEIDKDASIQAIENIERSPWQSRIEVVRADFKSYRPALAFDLIVSNPPYFIDSMKCPDGQRSTARHTNELSYEDLIEGVSVLLGHNGTFCIVIPTDVSEKVKNIALEYHLYPERQLFVITKPGAAPKRTLINFTFKEQDCYTEELLTEISRHQYSQEYIALTKDYYMKL
ncbi:methyltransferase [Bacteroides sp.]|uniref:tRNA1(Val) (adenine(37)-N6)-methyltransferase n=1 Tax=Bacteroides sp. TaxID=29523 RepID=UPI002FC68E19